MKSGYFFKEFKKDHRMIRDLLLDMITALLRQDILQLRNLLSDLDAIAGPHFRFEEESLYPSLISIYGESYINKLLTDHDLVIARSKKILQVIQQSDDKIVDFKDMINTVRAILPHVSDCEGLGIMVEKLPESKVQVIVECMKNARRENISLIEWSESLRMRRGLTLTVNQEA